jgi:DNA-binding response OmpR family regulator
MGKKVLIVDDEWDIVRTVEVILESHGFEVITAWNGVEALRRVVQDQPDLVLMDVAMPILGGLEAVKIMKADITMATIPVVLLTAMDTKADLERGWQSGTDLYLTKPINMQELVDYIEAILGRDAR